MAVAANWSELPKDLLILIWERLHEELDLIRFRSICSNWRSSSIPNHHPSVILKFPLPKSRIIPSDLNNKNITFRRLFKRRTFLIKPPQQQTPVRPWLMRITQNSSGKYKLCHPLFSYNSPSTSFHLPHLIDFNKLSVLHLGTDFINDDDLCPKVMYPRKVISVEKQSIVLGLLQNCLPQPVLFRCRNQRWRRILNISTFNGDICVFKERFYVVDALGRTVMIRPDSTVESVAEHVVSNRHKKLLVESDGELLLVDICESPHFSVDVFRLCEMEKKWMKLKNLGRRVLFLGHGCSFSASTSDLCVSKGNCVIFIDDAFLSFMHLQSGKCVFHLDQGRLSPMSHYPEYFKLFWPPPYWIFKS